MATVVGVLTIGSFALVQVFERQQLQQIDRRLTGASQTIEAAIAGAASMPAGAAGTAGQALVQVVDDDGTILFATERVRDAPAMRPVTGTDPSQPMTSAVGDLGSVRVVAIPLTENWVLYGESLQGVDEAVSGLTTVLVFGVPVLALVLGVLVWFFVGRTLRPVREAMDRERRLVADVSHELRTPLAGARALLESESRVPAEIELNRLEALAVLTRLEAMTNDLLVEARGEKPDPMRLDTLVDLDDAVLRVVDVVPARPGISVDPSAVSAGQVRGNEGDLERMVINLLTNAVRHARSTVRIELAERSGSVTLTVMDDGPGIAPDQRERAFERFTRLDDARSREDAGVGLGLPIARSVAEAHRGTIEVRDSELGGAAFVVTLPSAVALDGGRHAGGRNRSPVDPEAVPARR